MESPLSFFRMHWDHEPRQLVGRGVLTAPRLAGLGTARPTLWFMESPTSLISCIETMNIARQGREQPCPRGHGAVGAPVRDSVSGHLGACDRARVVMLLENMQIELFLASGPSGWQRRLLSRSTRSFIFRRLLLCALLV